MDDETTKWRYVEDPGITDLLDAGPTSGGASGGRAERWPVAAIRVGFRHRRDLGDIDTLAKSIRSVGLMQPITLTPDGTLICGARRVTAVKLLGWTDVEVWVCNGVSTRFQALLAELHENTARKQLVPTEAARMYREAKAHLAEDADRRRRATQFGAGNGTGNDGGAVAAPPLGAGKSRSQAAEFVTGQKSYTKLERVGELLDLAEGPDVPDEVRRLAVDALAVIDRNGKVAGPYKRAMAAIAEHTANQTPDNSHPEPSGEQGGPSNQEPGPGHDDPPNDQPGPGSGPGGSSLRRHGLQAFLSTMTDLKNWTEQYDPAEIGRALNTRQWAEFEAVATATNEFVDTARTARTRNNNAGRARRCRRQ